jgi:hypothetical protein
MTLLGNSNIMLKRELMRGAGDVCGVCIEKLTIKFILTWFWNRFESVVPPCQRLGQDAGRGWEIIRNVSYSTSWCLFFHRVSYINHSPARAPSSCSWCSSPVRGGGQHISVACMSSWGADMLTSPTRTETRLQFELHIKIIWRSMKREE